VRLLNDEEIKKLTGASAGFIGVVGLDCHIIVDQTVANMNDFVCGANKDDWHISGVNWERDAHYHQVADIRNAEIGDPSPDGNGVLKMARGIEVGHIFQLGSKYSKAMDAVMVDGKGNSQAMEIGCYGLGVSRMVAAAIEQNHDEKGIIWPQSIAPFQIAILPMNYHKSTRVREAADALYAELVGAGYEVLLDDRKVRPGFMFSDFELVGIPHQIVIGDKTLDDDQFEYKQRKDMQLQRVDRARMMDFVAEQTA